MLTQKAKELGLSNTKYYVDDGYTGTNFNRPAFQELLDDIEMGYISVVIVRDLSRLGRDYVSVGHYTDNYFPEHNVRFIAVNDMVDSDEGENEIAPFKNVMNEMYCSIKRIPCQKFLNRFFIIKYMLHSSIRLIETFGLVQTMQSLLSVVKKWFCVNITVFLLSMILGKNMK